MSVCINQKFINIHKTQTVPGVKVLDDVLREAAKKVILFSGPATRGGGLNLVAIGAFLVKNKFQKKCIPPPSPSGRDTKKKSFFCGFPYAHSYMLDEYMWFVYQTQIVPGSKVIE